MSKFATKKRIKNIDVLKIRWYKIICEKEGIKIKYESVNKLFNLIDVTDTYILLKDKEKTKKIYVYEIEPVTFLNFSMDTQSNILNLYNEFLRELNFEFQIYISNKKINVENYISNLEKVINKNANLRHINLMKRYLESITKELENEIIYTTKYYIVISFERDSSYDISQIDNIIKKLDYVGCNTKRIKEKKELKNILYESLNKEILA
jgi:hypothetical protein